MTRSAGKVGGRAGPAAGFTVALGLFMAGLSLTGLSLSGLSLAGAARSEEAPVSAEHVRTMILTCKLEESVAFYTDVLGMEVASDDGGKPVRLAPRIMAMPMDGILRVVNFKGAGGNPAPPINGGGIGLMGLSDQSYEACQNADAPNGRIHHRGIVIPMLVTNTAEILNRAEARGVDVVISELTPSGQSIQTIMYDPNGVLLELFELTEASTPG